MGEDDVGLYPFLGAGERNSIQTPSKNSSWILYHYIVFVRAFLFFFSCAKKEGKKGYCKNNKNTYQRELLEKKKCRTFILLTTNVEESSFSTLGICWWCKHGREKVAFQHYCKCVKFSWKFGEILSKIEWNSRENWVKFSWKLSEILVKIVWNSRENWVKFSWKLCEIFLKTECNCLENWVKFPLKLCKIFTKIEEKFS